MTQLITFTRKRGLRGPSSGWPVYTPIVKNGDAGPKVENLDGEWEAVSIPARLEKPCANAGHSWSPVAVPGHWQLEDVFSGHEGYVLYRRRFKGNVPHDGEMVSLQFGGVYYACRVWLNGTYLGAHEGYFAPFEFDCTDLILGGANDLLVEVHSPHEPSENGRKTLGGVWARWDGMDPLINPGGIFRPVALIRGGPVRVRSLGIEASPSGRCRATALVFSRKERDVTLRGLVRPVGFKAPWTQLERKMRLQSGETRVEIPFFLDEPRLWWTRDRGAQPLYEFRLSGPGFEENVRFGVRTVQLRGWQFYLNGERLFLRGVNYLPTDAYPARAPVKRLWADTRLLTDLDLNAVRVHAHVAEKAFYAACDELGILILQDFPLQWTHRRRVLKTAIEQAGEMARLLENHPSVGVYLAHDEPFYVAPPEKWSPLGLLRTVIEVLLPRWALWQRRTLGPAVVRVLQEEDPTRPVIEAAGHPLTTNHLYFGWYYGRFRSLERAVRLLPGLSRLPTEYGAQALPHPDSLEEIWPRDTEPDWQTLAAKYRLQRSRMELYAPYLGDRDAYVRESQAYQAELLKHATELFRRRKYRPTGGTFAFMLNDPAPAVSWSVVDWRRRPKSGYKALKQAMSPLLFCAGYPEEDYRVGETLDLPLFVVNDLAQSLGRVSWSWTLTLEGEEIAREEGTVDVPADSVTLPKRVRAVLPKTGRAALHLRLSGVEEAENLYRFAVTAASKKRRLRP